MDTISRTQQRYDHRLKELVRTTGNVQLAVQTGFPRSTAYGWLTSSNKDFVSLDIHDTAVTDLQREVVLLRYPAKPKFGIRAASPNEI
ncbi:MAG TPA: hypothetical protein DD473_08055 [Planctomycetaceae bacterium]|nr:hypothetical protein [Planctomycetaceae bacterium]